jgi:hypothetical protein
MMPVAETATCETYAALLEDFRGAREQWNARRTEISSLGLRGKRIDNELRCLQARFAKSYAAVRNHLGDCSCCELSRRIDHDSSHEDDVALAAEFRVSVFSPSRFSHI